MKIKRKKFLLAFGVMILIALLLLWLTDAMVSGDTDVNAEPEYEEELSFLGSDIYFA